MKPDNRLDADVAVVGLGSMGSLALWQLARRGVKAIGFEQFEPGHDRGSGHGESRIIRSCYAEGPQYVPLLQAAFPLWRQLEEETATELLTENGALFLGRLDSGFVKGARATADHHSLPYDILDPDTVQRRYPPHRLEAGEIGFLDLKAGFLRPELAVRTAVARAVQLGAQVVAPERVQAIQERGDAVAVQTPSRTYRAGHVIAAVGAWVGKLLPELGLPTWVERQVMVWYPARRPEEFTADRFPIFIRDRGAPDLTWYGFPSLDGSTVKVAIHHDGQEADPDRLDRDIRESDYEAVTTLVRRAIPGLEPVPVRGKVCMYTNTPDGHFVIGRPPGTSRIVMLGPMAGHGFKFAAVVGAIGADLATEGSTGLPIDAFSPARFETAAQPG
ncbi:MAG TPA: N-methyl-L-tryptophan oxidase [Candidatus Dormibacteraeota bacterium]|nr:N-methyl-L-tryptophan oxidase [Candidatus Dormibacteraeota bacterium]